jgi:hypothetical protein
MEKAIKTDEDYLRKIAGTFLKGAPHYANLRRIKLARAYQYLFSLNKDASCLKKARRILDEALNSADPAGIYHHEKRFVRYYFETLLAMAELYVQLDRKQASDYCERILSELAELEKVKFANPTQGRKESIPGFSHKALAIKARILELQGDHSRAYALYLKIIDWADREAKQGFWAVFPYVWNSTLFRDEDEDNIKYDASAARIRSGFILIRHGSNPEKALKYFKAVIGWERVGKLDLKTRASNWLPLKEEKEKEFLDLALWSLIGCMRAYAAAGDLRTAKARFERELPWEKIESYRALKKALKVGDLSSSQNKWDLVLAGLSNAALPTDELKRELAFLRDLGNSEVEQ